MPKQNIYSMDDLRKYGKNELLHISKMMNIKYDLNVHFNYSHFCNADELRILIYNGDNSLKASAAIVNAKTQEMQKKLQKNWAIRQRNQDAKKASRQKEIDQMHKALAKKIIIDEYNLPVYTNVEKAFLSDAKKAFEKFPHLAKKQKITA